MKGITLSLPDRTDSTTKAESSETISELKKMFASHLREAGHLKQPQGVATGYTALDNFLFWQGIPKGALSLFSGALGSGCTSLWIGALTQVIQKNLWAAWINGDVPLSPLPLHHKKLKLGHLMCLESPTSEDRLFWLLQELMSSGLFELIGCDLGSSLRLKEHQLRKLQMQARTSQVALVFLSQQGPPQGSIASVYSLILRFEKHQLLIHRALHRPTPHSFVRSPSYARFTLHSTDRISPDILFSSPQHSQSSSSALPQTTNASHAGRRKVPQP